MKCKKGFIYILISVFLITPITTFNSFAQLKIGLINSTIIAENYSEMVEIQKQITELGQKHQKELQDLQNELTTKAKQYESQKLLLSEEKKKQTEKDLEDLYRKGLQYQQDKLGAGGELEKKYKELTDPIVKKINDAIDRVAKEDKFDLVFDIVNMGIVFASPEKTIDITQKTLDVLNKGVKKTTP